MFKSTNLASFVLIGTTTGYEPYDIATNYTGQYVYAALDGGFLEISIDFGANWNKIWLGTTSSVSRINKITVDGTGQYSAAATESDGIYITNNYWTSFTKSNAQNISWSGITSNSTGQFLTAVTTSDSFGIYNSNDYGMNWSTTNTPNVVYTDINMNSSGNIATAITSSNVYVSFNAAN